MFDYFSSQIGRQAIKKDSQSILKLCEPLCKISVYGCETINPKHVKVPELHHNLHNPEK